MELSAAFEHTYPVSPVSDATGSDASPIARADHHDFVLTLDIARRVGQPFHWG